MELIKCVNNLSRLGFSRSSENDEEVGGSHSQVLLVRHAPILCIIFLRLANPLHHMNSLLMD